MEDAGTSSALLSTVKSNLRRKTLLLRDSLTVAEREAASAHLCSRLAALPELVSTQSVSAFWPLGSEVDLRPLLEKWQQEGKAVALPVMVGGSLIFRRWEPGCTMERKPFGVMEPGIACPEIAPQILLIPLVAFDRKGGRLGYGKGFYDRAIAALPRERRSMTIGIAFAIQEMVSIPLEPHDQLLGTVVTEAEVIRVLR